jgi:hypothetical protein
VEDDEVYLREVRHRTVHVPRLRALRCGETNAEIRAAREVLEGVGRRLELEDIQSELERLKLEVGIT